MQKMLPLLIQRAGGDVHARLRASQLIKASNNMSNVCERCGRSNRTSAMFCIGCTAKLPGFAPSGPSALEAMKALSARPSSAASGAESAPGYGPQPILPSETKAFWVQLAALGVLMMIGFMGWFMHVRATPAPVREALLPAPNATGSQVVANKAPPPEPTLVTARASTVLPEPDLGQQPNPTAGEMRKPEGKPADASPHQPGRHPQLQAVENFYRALSVADGRSAAAFIIPAKRGIGPFNETNISRFYGSFAQPLRIRSIRAIDANLVEAKYSYRVSRTACEGTALLETEQVGDATFIRRIRANC
ncbi:hypothetical protein [Variovorax sp. GT1P44]|uniref:hypothetical protein n=1 Tax=Variovorax sp. GT1P44 TaxID=3443742 RepID=UPI003F44B844